MTLLAPTLGPLHNAHVLDLLDLEAKLHNARVMEPDDEIKAQYAARLEAVTNEINRRR